MSASSFFARLPWATPYISLHILGSGWGDALHKTFWTTGKFTGLIFGQTESLYANIRLLLLPLSCLFMIGGEYLQRKVGITEWLAMHSPMLRWAAYYALVIWIIIFGYYMPRTFIYFQF